MFVVEIRRFLSIIIWDWDGTLLYFVLLRIVKIKNFYTTLNIFIIFNRESSTS